ncbi:hypothetical protein HispidOSU_013536, partial [Sigmodon hispidus]
LLNTLKYENALTLLSQRNCAWSLQYAPMVLNVSKNWKHTTERHAATLPQIVSAAVGYKDVTALELRAGVLVSVCQISGRNIDWEIVRSISDYLSACNAGSQSH